MLDQALQALGLKARVELSVMRRNQSLEGLTARLMTRIGEALRRLSPAAILVQGDTTTTFVASLGAYYAGIPCGHVEAGLRTYNPRSPFPEETNRRLTDHLCTWHFAPTELGRRQLLREGISRKTIWVTGNTVVDALLWMKKNGRPSWPKGLVLSSKGSKILLVTVHRRESFGAPMKRLFRTFRRIVAEFTDVEIVYPVHLNPNVRQAAAKLLEGVPRIHLIEPVSYPALVTLLDRCHLVLTDSGGLQEEAPSLGKPVLVLRPTTERPEGLKQGTSRLVGTQSERIVEALGSLLRNRAAYLRMSRRRNPYGDGRAAPRIVRVLERELIPARIRRSTIADFDPPASRRRRVPRKRRPSSGS
jgi:UDP-N-acetylglucosamine 2-epimerase (non-hydrolysing)